MNILRIVAEEYVNQKSVVSPEFHQIELLARQSFINKEKECIPTPQNINKLSSLEYYVTQEKGTERPSTGKYLNMNDEGIYLCIVCNHPLFDSNKKFDACGWPSFSDVIDQQHIIYQKDTSQGMSRIEVTCKYCNAHLGHVFDEGSHKKNKIRYCINSASLNFKPKDQQ